MNENQNLMMDVKKMVNDIKKQLGKEEEWERVEGYEGVILGSG